MIQKDTYLYDSIEKAILDIFNAEIPMDDPYETTDLFVNRVNKHLEEEEE